MNKKNMLMGLALVLSVALWSPAAVLAGEHGGQKAAGGEHGGAAMEGSHGMTEDHMATLQEAADLARQSGRDDLAKKLEDMAKM
ncbi:MAG: hypothetical protein A3G87_03630 [Omnitrophica bacterium RIFCSPLOWO2_12_FULL_50_11]|nr:MAG: hypothetical protein A3G87_03630 [Omnitrophica bacterium RIFCSPLOWO2_12_FULL_50_11]